MKKFIQSMLIGGAILLNMGNLTGCNSEKAGSKSMFYSENEVVDIAKKHLEEKYEGKNFKVEMVEIPGMYYSRYDLKGTELETGSTFTVYATFTSKEDYTVTDNYITGDVSSELYQWAFDFFEENLDTDFKLLFASCSTPLPEEYDKISDFDEYMQALKETQYCIRMSVVLPDTEFSKDYTKKTEDLASKIKSEGLRCQIEIISWQDPNIYPLIELQGNFTVIWSQDYKKVCYSITTYTESPPAFYKRILGNSDRKFDIEIIKRLGGTLPDQYSN